MTAAQHVEALISYASARGLLDPFDIRVARNKVLALLRIAEPFTGAPQLPESPEAALAPILDYAAQSGILAAGTIDNREKLAAEIMGIFTPPPSVIIPRFAALAQQSPQAATDWFHALSCDANYVQTARIAKNLRWRTPSRYGELEITVNLSKPEKDPRDIALATATPQSGYPKCLICAENEGFAGDASRPARQNLRLIPMELAGETWYLQYSPYAYYNEHCIVLSREHTSMQIKRATFCRMLDFIERMPHYFIGSNADLPIVGGSILMHDHYQGGRHAFPMESAALLDGYERADLPGMRISRLDWPLSVIRISCAAKQPLIDFADEITDTWRGYSDIASGVLAHTDAPHNTVTPIARVNSRGEFELDLALRNNRTSAEHPMGIFHPHAEHHHVKKENIGLIEVMGLAVLPGRLAGELDAGRITRDEIGSTFVRVLEDAGVFKQTPAGQAAFDRFMVSALRLTAAK